MTGIEGATFGRCRSCHRNVALMATGNVRAHDWDRARCPGSAKAPKARSVFS